MHIHTHITCLQHCFTCNPIINHVHTHVDVYIYIYTHILMLVSVCEGSYCGWAISCTTCQKLLFVFPVPPLIHWL